MFDKQQPIQKDKLHDQVYNRLCTMLRQGEFTPGEPVPVAHIADAFGISPMPVREALTRLLAKGVLTNVSGLSLIHISEPTRLLSIAYAVLCV